MIHHLYHLIIIDLFFVFWFLFYVYIIINRGHGPLAWQSLVGVAAIIPEFTSRVIPALYSLSNCLCLRGISPFHLRIMVMGAFIDHPTLSP